MTYCHVEKILHMRNVKKICGKLCVQCMVFCRILRYFVAESVFCDLRCFVAKYVPRDSRAFAWRQILQEIVPVEKK